MKKLLSRSYLFLFVLAIMTVQTNFVTLAADAPPTIDDPFATEMGPTINSALTASGTVGSSFSYTITAGGTPPITYSASGLPAGLSLSGAVISGTPTSAGSSSVTLTAQNSIDTDSKTLVINIAAATPAGTAPNITSGLSASGTVGSSFSYQITASGSTPISYNATNLPAGLTFGGDTISGNPTTAGTTNINLSAQNSSGTSTKVLVLTILASPVLPDAEDAPPALTLPPATALPVTPAPAPTAPAPTTPAVPAPTSHAAAPAKTAASVPITNISKSGPEIIVLAFASALIGAGYRKFKK